MGRDKRWAKVFFHNLGLIILKPICDWICKNQHVVASFPGPTQLSVACSAESGRRPGIFYHVSDVECREKGKEDLIERRRIVDVPTSIVV